MQTADIIIAGGGLSGLYAAWLLERQGIRNYVILEAREAPGGRIRSFQSTELAGGIDLGPTWYWPDFQPELDLLIRELGLDSFPQHENGDMIIERATGEEPLRLPGYVTTPASMRLQGGMSALIAALASGINADAVIAGIQVRRIRKCEQYVEVDCEDNDGVTNTWRAHHVLLAIPPRLAAENISFSPALPYALSDSWRSTATWMAPHAKYIALYDRPFWREQGLSGEARSAIGVLGEIHDASMPGGAAALFGFFRLPPGVRSRMPDDVMRTHCRAQMGRIFGPGASSPIADVIQDWAREPFTATRLDLAAEAHHDKSPASFAADGDWSDCLTGIASEWSPQYPGYVAGAIEAARIGVQHLTKREIDT